MIHKKILSPLNTIGGTLFLRYPVVWVFGGADFVAELPEVGGYPIVVFLVKRLIYNLLNNVSV